MPGSDLFPDEERFRLTRRQRIRSVQNRTEPGDARLRSLSR
jgi:hypothetical protein